MPRNKSYNEKEVAMKAMRLFWSNGYRATSTRNLQNEMGINLFSIYSSFKNKDGVFLESIKCYKELLRQNLLKPLAQKPKNVIALKCFFYDFLRFTKNKGVYRGCFLINTANELGHGMSIDISNQIGDFSKEIRAYIYEVLSYNTQESIEDLERKTNYLFVALQGVSLSAKALTKKQIDDYIEFTFLNI